MHPALERLSEEHRRLLRSGKPELITPMLATLHKEHVPRGAWVYERKYDGVRVIAVVEKGSARLFSRNKKPLAQYPELLEALPTTHDAVLDGEIVALKQGVPNFSKLQGRMQRTTPEAGRRSGIPITGYFFDIIHLDGYDLTRLPLTARRSILEGYLEQHDALHLSSTHRDGEALLKRLCNEGWEGIIAKRAHSTYQQRRSQDWRKVKCTRRQEFVIGGYTEPQGSRTGFGALLLGYYEGGALRYAGKVGTGFDDALLAHLRERLQDLTARESPFAEETPTGIYVEPVLVGEVAFTEWTGQGRLRHPSFLGLRDDKPAEAVVRE